MRFSLFFTTVVLVCNLLPLHGLSSHTAKNITLAGKLTYSTAMSNLWGYVDSAGNEYALVGLYNGVSVVNVTDPANPREVFFASAPAGDWREIQTWKRHAFVTNETSGGLMIIDLSTLPQDTNLKVSWFTGNNYPFSRAHTLAIDSNGICYIFGANYGAGGVIILNVDSAPKNPQELGVFNNFYIHDGMVRHDTLWAAAMYIGKIAVIDVKNKSAPSLITQFTTGPPTFTHNCWLSDDSRFLFTTDEKSGAYLAAYDVSDLSNVKMVDRIQSAHSAGSIVHNTFYRNGYLITSYYTDGVLLHDAARPHNLIETGFYDTSPYSGTGFNGCWGVYPWLPSGNIIASDIEAGLFILKPTYKRACYLEGIVFNSKDSARMAGVSVQLLPDSLITFTDDSGRFAFGTVDSGPYSVRFSKTGFLSKIIDSVALSNGVVTTLDAALDTALPFTATISTRSAATNDSLGGVHVALFNSDVHYNFITDSAGTFKIDSFFQGHYSVISGKWGFATRCFLQFIDSSGANVVITMDTGYSDDFSFDFGWSITGDARDGAWIRSKPLGTIFMGRPSNPDADVLGDCSDSAFVTKNSGGAGKCYDGGIAKQYDVDSGRTVLTSPLFHLAAYDDPYITYYRWFFNADSAANANDTLICKINNTVMDRITWADTAEMSRWVHRAFRLRDFLAPSDSMLFRIETADDAENDDMVEGGLDHFRVYNRGAPPKAQFFYGKTNICPGDSVLFYTHAPPVHQVQWVFSGGKVSSPAARQTYIVYDSIGSYDARIIITDSLFGADTLTIAGLIQVLPCTVVSFAAEEKNHSPSLRVYPNPTRGVFHVEIPNVKSQVPNNIQYPISNIQISVYNLLGELVYNHSFTHCSLPIANCQLPIDLSNQPTGVYHVVVVGDGHGMSGTVVVE